MSVRTSAGGSSARTGLVLVLQGAAAVALLADAVVAQRVTERASSSGPAPLQVVIEREPLQLRPAESFKVSLHLDPVKSILLAAQVDGVVGDVHVKMGQTVQAQELVVRLDSRDRQLELNRAQAALEAAKISHASADTKTRELAAAQLKVANIDVELAQYRVDQTSLRAPFDGVIQQVHVIPGQFVRAGEPLATVIDPTQLQVELPIDRNTVQDGDDLTIQVEADSTRAKVQGVLPLNSRFEPLRELFESVASGIVIIENGDLRFQPGQTVYTSLIPRVPVASVPNSSIGNTDQGGRRVQVIRDGFVRNIDVDLLGAVGEEQTVVAGRLNSRDELIVRCSEDLLDGTQVVPRMQLEAAADGADGGQGKSSVPGRSKQGF
jgi:membrane fusion protein (multidrug efflux system)